VESAVLVTFSVAMTAGRPRAVSAPRTADTLNVNDFTGSVLAGAREHASASDTNTTRPGAQWDPSISLPTELIRRTKPNTSPPAGGAGSHSKL
jgi:hypothetical protein